MSEDAEKVVDAVGEALGVDTGTVSESRFDAAVDAAEKLMSELNDLRRRNRELEEDLVKYKAFNGTYNGKPIFEELDRLTKESQQHLWLAVRVEELEPFEDEVIHLRRQRDELQARGSELITENRVLKAEIATLRQIIAIDTPTNGPRYDTRRADVLDFFAIAGQMPGRLPHDPGTKEIRFRAELNVEETFELVEACIDHDHWDTLDYSDNPSELKPAVWLKRVKDMVIENIRKNFSIRLDLVKVVDALTDIDYVSEGFRIALGVDGYPFWIGIHKANMDKKGGPKDPITGKHLRPEGWKPFDVAGELKRQGWIGLEAA